MRIDIYDDNIPTCDPFEYFCMNCGTMNLSYVDIQECGNCSHIITIKGKPFELDVEKLRQQFYELPKFLQNKE